MPAVLTLIEAAKLTSNPLVEGIARTVVETDQMAAYLQFAALPFTGHAVSYEREGLLPSAHTLPDDGTMQTASVGTPDIVTVQLRGIAGDIDVVALADDMTRGAAMGRQVQSKFKAVWETVKDRFINGSAISGHTLGSSAAPFTAIDAIEYGPNLVESERLGDGEIEYVHASTSWRFRAPGDLFFGDLVSTGTTDGVYELRSFNRNKLIKVTLDVSDATANGRTWIRFSGNYEFEGMNRLCAPGMVIPATGADGDLFTFETLDNLMDTVKERSRLAFVMNGKMANRFLSLQRSLGGTTPENMRIEGYSGTTLAYRNVPVLINDNVNSTEAKGASGNTLSSVYLASFDASSGLFAGVPSFTESHEVDGDPRNVVVLGWRVVQLGELQDKAVKRTRIKWFGCLGLKSEKALARAKNLKLTAT